MTARVIRIFVAHERSTSTGFVLLPQAFSGIKKTGPTMTAEPVSETNSTTGQKLDQRGSGLHLSSKLQVPPTRRLRRDGVPCLQKRRATVARILDQHAHIKLLIAATDTYCGIDQRG
jgi:hypothetical protein